MKDNEQDYRWILDQTIEATRNMDNKNGIITAILAVITAVLFSNETFIDCIYSAFTCNKPASTFAVIIAAIAASVVAFSLFASIFPRTKCKDGSLIYAGGIAECKSASDYKARLADSCYDPKSDLISQIYTNAKIYKAKARWNRVATGSLCILIVSIVIFSALTMVGV